MGRYEILLGKKGNPQHVRGIDTGDGPDVTARAVWVNGAVHAVANSPDDVTVCIDGRLVMVESVDGVRGEVVLVETPKVGDFIKIEYYYNRDSCYKETEVINGLSSSIYYVSKVPMVKCGTVPQLELRSVCYETGGLVYVNAREIVSSRPIQQGDHLSVDSKGVLRVGDTEPIAVVAFVEGEDITIKLNVIPTVSPDDELDLPF